MACLQPNSYIFLFTWWTNISAGFDPEWSWDFNWGIFLINLINPVLHVTFPQFWKVKKVLRASIKWVWGFPKIQLNATREESEAESKTRAYDEECMTYLSYLLYPLCLVGAVYSLLYQPHKRYFIYIHLKTIKIIYLNFSWYSWSVNSLANGVYVFGFLFMLPQLFINYRLKSVAALPWRVFTYRAFTTFIDDIFAFIITMPTAHRLACFRDDIVFIIYLYQRW